MKAAATATRTVYVPGAAGPIGRLLRKHLHGWHVTPKIGRGSVDAVVHLDYDFTIHATERSFERNVFGALESASRAVEAGARTVVMVSSTMVYGARSKNPNFLPETRRIRLKHATPYIKDMSEVERYAQSYLRHTGARLVILRLARVVGPNVDSPMMRYIRMARPPTALGFDPHLQLLHEEDAARAAAHALETDFAGPVNIAPDGIVPLLLLLRRLGRPYVPVFHPLFPLTRKAAPIPFDPTYLMYNCCGDNRRMKQEFGFEPKWSHAQILEAMKKWKRRSSKR